jgi:disulfide bond formation protein DsbB
MPSRAAANRLGAAACAAALTFAFYAQYGMNLVPCHLCIFQRVTLAALGVAFVLAAPLSRPGARGILFATLIFLAGAATIAAAGRHVWIQMQPEGAVPSCGADLDFMLELFPLTEVILKVFQAGGECGKIDWSFLGLSMPAWVLILAGLLTAGGVWVNARRAG